jgi:hypothetical protein
MTDTPSPQPAPKRGRELFANLAFGLKVLGDEARYLALNGLRGVEIRQMEKRLAEECAALGELVASAVGPDPEPATAPLDDAARLSLKQIAFLREELALLRSQREGLRAEVLARRSRTLGLDDPEL